MSYWIYNMGMPVQVSPDQLIARRQVKSLSELSKTSSFDQTTDTIEPKKQSKAISGYQQSQDKSQPKPITRAEQIMSTTIKYLYENMKFFDAWAEFKQHGYRHFPVLNRQNLIVGIISDRDMLAAAASSDPNKIIIKQIMNQPVLTASENALIAEVCQIMFNRHIGALPITNSSNKILGLITRSDILRSMIKHGPIQLWI